MRDYILSLAVVTTLLGAYTALVLTTPRNSEARSQVTAQGAADREPSVAAQSSED